MIDDSQHTKAANASPVRAECFLLCDRAQVENGKLYILGGGWDEVAPPRLPFRSPVAMAVKLVLPRERAAAGADVAVDVVDADGREIEGSAIGARVEVGAAERVAEESPGAPRETAVFLALETVMEIAQPGRFGVRLRVDDEVVATTGFTVRSPAVGSEPRSSGE